MSFLFYGSVETEKKHDGYQVSRMNEYEHTTLEVLWIILPSSNIGEFVAYIKTWQLTIS